MTTPEKEPTNRKAEAIRLLSEFLGGFAGGLFGGMPTAGLYTAIADLKRSRESIDDKIQRASQSLQEASQLVLELEQSLEERTEKLTYLRDEVEKYSQLAEIEENKAAAIIHQLEFTLNKGKTRERWVSLIINLVAGVIIFIIGIVLGPVITKLL
ncbi:MAG TPA: hypothetical protein VGP08_08725 [Pyrinomonadaceae bacterium]|jgi:hypothetical protein|nr:hypothetical protein [Pyrinomonadaceae bacterium]